MARGLSRGLARSLDKIREDRSAEDQKYEPLQRSVYDPSGCVMTHWATRLTCPRSLVFSSGRARIGPIYVVRIRLQSSGWVGVRLRSIFAVGYRRLFKMFSLRQWFGGYRLRRSRERNGYCYCHEKILLRHFSSYSSG